MLEPLTLWPSPTTLLAARELSYKNLMDFFMEFTAQANEQIYHRGVMALADMRNFFLNANAKVTCFAVVNGAFKFSDLGAMDEASLWKLVRGLLLVLVLVWHSNMDIVTVCPNVYFVCFCMHMM